MPLVPNFAERALFLTFNMGPAPLLDVWSAVAFRMVLAAVRLRIFEALAGGARTPEALAASLGTDAHATRLLLDTLEALGYVSRDAASGAYANTAMTTKWMVGSGATFGAGFEFWGVNLFQLMDQLEETVRSGQPSVNLYQWIEDQPEASRAFQDWMVALADFAGDAIIKLAPPPQGARRLLDIGGGHGRYAMAYCQQYPQLRVTVFDSPQALKAAEAGLQQNGLGGRVTLQAGDFLTDDMGQDYDMALLLNIVHGFSDTQNKALVERSAGALAPGGLLVVGEQLSGREPTPMINATKSLLGMSYFHLLGGQLYSYEDVAGWMQAAGLENVRRVSSMRLPGTSLVLGTRP